MIASSGRLTRSSWPMGIERQTTAATVLADHHTMTILRRNGRYAKCHHALQRVSSRLNSAGYRRYRYHTDSLWSGEPHIGRAPCSQYGRDSVRRVRHRAVDRRNGQVYHRGRGGRVVISMTWWQVGSRSITCSMMYDLPQLLGDTIIRIDFCRSCSAIA